jgi:hypothetical protein
MLTQIFTQFQYFEFTELLSGLVIFEALQDIHGWDNATTYSRILSLYWATTSPPKAMTG